MQTIQYILPEIFLSISIFVMIIVGVFIKDSYKIVNNSIILLLLFTILLIFKQQNEFIKIFNQSYIIDHLSTFHHIHLEWRCSLRQLKNQILVHEKKI